MSTWAAHSAQASSARSSSVSSSPLVLGLVAGSRHGTTAGQPVSITSGSVDGGAFAQPTSSSRERLISPMAQFGVFTLQLLDLVFALGEALAQQVLRAAQGGLRGALGLQGIGEGGDGDGLALNALLGVLLTLGGQHFASLDGLALLVLAPEQQAEGGEQGEAVADLAQGGHAATCWPQPQPAWRS